MVLNDAEIRPSLIEFLLAKSVKPRKIIEELHVHRGNAIADVVAIHSEAHCYEIKGDNDKVERANKQGEYFNKTFSKVSLVTTRKNLNKAIKLVPPFWGVIVAFEFDGVIKFKYYRKAGINPFFDKSLALATLWRSELDALGDELKIDMPKKVNKREFASELSYRMSKSQITKSIANTLAQRVKNHEA
ncbi:sce7726 family protein [Shewanella algae]|uniref:sce7726 family protein n=1 Tax=Shewanella algae TaxID=38313 RepID=UPI0031F4ACEF